MKKKTVDTPSATFSKSGLYTCALSPPPNHTFCGNILCDLLVFNVLYFGTLPQHTHFPGICFAFS